ncbi:DUF2842 domain-containing protein [Roseomonas sp. OT10]|uniref:DUF2842 domain-containing protein n=1 Tax=Roseomonas cutis TaxID=2897332 RepID=UPI001E3DE1D8|nr:DUF2842 domain-containing protein [Roseomonas sp. OT10]UFN47171.1 DUF2842 domain-containing protein [Roseomonas sp. OT10]
MSRPVIACLVGLLGFALYVGAVVALGDHLIGRHWALQALYFVVVGTAWVWPAARLLRWAYAR